MFVVRCSIASLQKGFTESIYGGVCTYVCTLAILVGLPVAFIIKDDPIVQYGIIGALILLCTLTTAILMLIGKVNNYENTVFTCQ